MKAHLKGLQTFLIFILFFIFLRIFVWDFYKVSSVSMEPSLLSGDYILVNKQCYGPRFLNITKLIISGKIEYEQAKRLDLLKKNDVIVFDLPQFDYLFDSLSHIYGPALIKRVFGCPGDSISFQTEYSTSIGLAFSDRKLSSSDTNLYWRIHSFGPLYIPQKGDTLHFSINNYQYFKNIILYENTIYTSPCDSIFMTHYVFKKNYFFTLGDNFYNSRDSRFWGFLPETHIIGKASTILFSLDPDKPWYRKFRWNRFLKKIV